MPLIHKRRIWWEPIPEAKSYVVYVNKDGNFIDPANFFWEDTPSIIFKPVIGKSEVIIPDEWPEFPISPGTYHIAITSKDDVGNQSDPFLLSGLFRFVAPRSPSKGGVENLPVVHLEPGSLAHSLMRQGRRIIQGSLEEVKNNKEVGDAYFRGS